MPSRMSVMKPELAVEVALRMALWSLFSHMEAWTPFERKIHQEEMWLYKNPTTPSYVPSDMMWSLVMIVPLVVFSVSFLVRRDHADFVDSLLAYTLALSLNGVVTDTIKLTVGRPRPDFFYRCFPDGTQYPGMKCTGNPETIKEGRKSFPSGHSSFSFTAMWFIFLFLSAKLRVFSLECHRRRFMGLRLFAIGIPPMIALLVAISRTCDYHHHWQDVTVGSFIGIAISWLCYRQYYPSLSDPLAASPRSAFPVYSLNREDSMARLLPVESEKDLKLV